MSKNAQLRIFTGLSVIVGLALALFLRGLTVYIFDVVLLAILFIGVFEVMRATNAKERGVKHYFIYAYLVCAYLVFAIGCAVKNPFSLWLHLIAQLVVLLIFLTYTFFMYYVDSAFIKHCNLKKLKVGTETWRIISVYLKIVAYPASCVYAFFALNHLGAGAPSAVNIGLFALLLVFVISASTDTCAYVVGVTFKGKKLCPKISPKKTWSGAVGGLFGGMMGSLVLLLVYSSNSAFGSFFLDKGIDATLGLVVFAFVGLLGSVVTQFGDIFASFIKRKYGIKDYGKILPGHGGVMDRVDGHIFTAVFIFIVMAIICFVL